MQPCFWGKHAFKTFTTTMFTEKPARWFVTDTHNKSISSLSFLFLKTYCRITWCLNHDVHWSKSFPPGLLDLDTEKNKWKQKTLPPLIYLSSKFLKKLFPRSGQADVTFVSMKFADSKALSKDAAPPAPKAQFSSTSFHTISFFLIWDKKQILLSILDQLLSVEGTEPGHVPNTTLPQRAVKFW